MNKINQLSFRLKIRKELTKLPKELMLITLEETKRALEILERKNK